MFASFLEKKSSATSRNRVAAACRTTKDRVFWERWQRSSSIREAYLDWVRVRTQPITILSAEFCAAFAHFEWPHGQTPTPTRARPSHTHAQVLDVDGTRIWQWIHTYINVSSDDRTTNARALIAWMLATGRRVGETLDKNTTYRLVPNLPNNVHGIAAQGLHKLTNTFYCMRDTRFHGFLALTNSSHCLKTLDRVRTQPPVSLAALARSEFKRHILEAPLHASRAIYVAMVHRVYRMPINVPRREVSASLLQHASANVTREHYEYIRLLRWVRLRRRDIPAQMRIQWADAWLQRQRAERALASRRVS